jgi:GlpG protein
MYWLHQLGHVVEDKVGGKLYLLSILWISVLSNVGFYLWIGPHFVGMSGVIYGLVGFLWAYQKFSPREFQEFDASTLQFFLLWYMACWLLSAAKILHVANSIHGVGLLAGILFALGRVSWQLRTTSFRILRQEPLATWGIVLALVAGGLLTDLWVY